MAWVAVNKDNTEVILAHYPKWANEDGCAFGKEELKAMWLDGGDFVILPYAEELEKQLIPPKTFSKTLNDCINLIKRRLA